MISCQRRLCRTEGFLIFYLENMFSNTAFEVVIGLLFIFLLYSMLAIIVHEIIAQIFDLKARMLIKAIRVGMTAINTIRFISLILDRDQYKHLIEKITFYKTFLTDIINADSSKHFMSVLENYALPVKSYRINREAASSFTLATYPGLYGGVERNKDVKEGKLKDGVFGVTAPIGFAFNLGTKHSESWSVFLSMVDIGAALSYRWNSDTADIPNKITLGQIFSPGINLIYGIKVSPLAFKLGYQYAPQLRNVETDQNIVQTGTDVWRLNLGLNADIPVLIFSTRSKKH